MVSQSLLGPKTAPSRPRVPSDGIDDGSDAGAAAVGLLARGGPLPRLHVAVVAGVAAVLLQPREDSVIDVLRSALAERARERSTAGGVRVGVGDAVPGLQARRSWLQARLAERFAVPVAEPVVVHGELGSLTLLAEIPVARSHQATSLLAGSVGAAHQDKPPARAEAAKERANLVGHNHGGIDDAKKTGADFKIELANSPA